MNLQEVRAAAKDKLKGWCRVCPVCNGRACAGEVPGMGGVGTGAAFMENIRALEAWKLNLRTLHDASSPDPSVELFGTVLSLPVMGAPIAGSAYNLGGALSEEDLVNAFTGGCCGAGTISWTGDGAEPSLYLTGLAAIKARGGKGIPTIKPRGTEEIIKRIRLAEEAGALAVAIDVDAAGFHSMAAKGQPVGPIKAGDIAALVAATPLPLILKGIMTPDEAVLAASLGVSGIVVSNHGGRVLESCPGTADVLPGIAAAVKGKIRIILDGGVRSGADVLKALALGADCVLVGRPLVTAAVGGGAEGVALALRGLSDAFLSALLLTGTSAARHVSPRVLTRTS